MTTILTILSILIVGAAFLVIGLVVMQELWRSDTAERGHAEYYHDGDGRLKWRWK